MNKNIPKTVSFSGESLAMMKSEGLVSDAALAELKKRADEHLNGELLAVTERMAKAPSGNPHDYASLGTYWWPNPDTPDGLPYVRYDGKRNPVTTETASYRNMTTRAFELALAAYYFDSEEYGRACAKVLCDWHLNPKTYMTPHAKYSQSIPGICDGRNIGIIDFSMSSYRVFDSVAILEHLGFIDNEHVEGLKRWYNEFTDWLLTSENGIGEDTEHNNHGTFFDVHLLAAGIFCGREALIKKVCQTSYERRFKTQIEPDGKQPLELARTMGMVYSISNITGLLLIANMASGCGWTEYISSDVKYGDAAVKKAIDYIYPYTLALESFPYSEIKPEIVPEKMKGVLLFADRIWSGEGYGDKANKVSDKTMIESAYPGI